jgi:hypothetical protein
MLWMKAWLEMRWRLVFALAVVLAPVGGSYFNGIRSPAEAGTVMTLVAFLWLFCAVVLAGAGIRTQSPIQGTKGLHGSTYFTLSLPVSRLRLLSVRAAMGMAGVLAMILVSSALAWSLLPMLRAQATGTHFLRWIFTVCCVTSVFHALSIFNSTFLEENLQIWGTVAVIGLIKLLTVWVPLPRSLDVFRLMTESPLLTHSIPWPAIALSIGLAGLVFFLAVKIAETREY